MQKTAFFMANLLLRFKAFWARADYQPASRRVFLGDRLQSGFFRGIFDEAEQGDHAVADDDLGVVRIG
jgi:hypothetical protein